MAPIPEWVHAVIHQQVITSDASFAEKAIVILVVGHILVLYTLICWLVASTVTAADSRDHRTGSKNAAQAPPTGMFDDRPG